MFEKYKKLVFKNWISKLFGVSFDKTSEFLQLQKQNF